MNFSLNDVTSVETGDWQTNISATPVTLLPGQIENLELVLNKKYLPSVRRRFWQQHPEGNLSMHNFNIPAPVVRFDMAPMTSEKLGIYEIEANTAGHSIAMKVGVPMHVYLADALKKMGVSRLGYAVTASRQEQDWDLQLLMNGLGTQGIDVRRVDLANGVSDLAPLWLRSGQEDLATDGLVMPRFNQCLQWHIDGGGSKSYLFDIDPTARRLGDFVVLETIPERYKAGIVLKEIGGWGTRGVDIYARENPYKKSGTATRTKLVERINRIFDNGQENQYLIQEFVPPAYVNKGYLMWRIMGVFDAEEGRYKVVGGVWNWRRSTLRLHGADDAVFGPILT